MWWIKGHTFQANYIPTHPRSYGSILGQSQVWWGEIKLYWLGQCEGQFCWPWIHQQHDAAVLNGKLQVKQTYMHTISSMSTQGTWFQLLNCICLYTIINNSGSNRIVTPWSSAVSHYLWYWAYNQYLLWKNLLIPKYGKYILTMLFAVNCAFPMCWYKVGKVHLVL